ncbi:MAG: gas vesicle protein [Acetobacteraceae bacterium]|nr:gas vesicle protein [Acetobacteraceae bacterium]
MPPTLDQLVRAGTQRIAELTGLGVSTVTGMTREEDRWRLSLELVEKQSVPHAMDILGRYDVWLDDQGNLMGFERRELRKRGDTYCQSTSNGS